MDYILALSYGKDSLACLGAIKELDWKLDRIIHAEIWATDTIPADLPPMVEFKEKADKIIKDKFGYEVQHVRAKHTYEEIFYRVKKKGKREGEIYGFPYTKGAWCNDRLKVSTMQAIQSGCTKYIGIAADEPERIKNELHTMYPLKEANWTEKMCYDWCVENDLLSPIYKTAMRGGCWFCHNQGIDQLRILRKTYPEYWALLLKWDSVSPIPFKPDHTLHDYERRFLAEDNGHIEAGDRRFRWEILDEIDVEASPEQLKFF